MNHYETINEYYNAINLEHPNYNDFDIGRIEDIAKTIQKKMGPISLNAYSIIIKTCGKASVSIGQNLADEEAPSFFFITPHQLFSWEIETNCEGYYVSFTPEYLAKNTTLTETINQLTLVNNRYLTPFTLTKEQSDQIVNYFFKIESEFHENFEDKFAFIELYLLLILTYIKRFKKKQDIVFKKVRMYKLNEVKIFSEYQNKIIENFSNANGNAFNPQYLTTSFYAKELGIHPNYLNMVSKKVSGITASSHIQKHVINLAKVLLTQTGFSIKEISNRLHFDSQSTFNKYFKKRVEETPKEYRKKYEDS